MLRYIRARPRLFTGAVLGFAVAALLPGHPGTTLRAVIGWDCGTAVFLALTVLMAARATAQSMRQRAAAEDVGRWVFLALMAAAAFFSMFAILGIMRAAKAAGGDAMVVMTIVAAVTVLLSWLFAHTAFALHYAHGFFSDLAVMRPPGLAFPGDRDDPDYWDFLYFSFVIGMTAQVSDVQVLTPPWRRLVLAHGIFSFLFNTVVLALSINLIAGFF